MNADRDWKRLPPSNQETIDEIECEESIYEYQYIYRGREEAPFWGDEVSVSV